ncbi:MAG TPA: tetratricopeptide repeat protein [Pyrinomonadaceae bacterium]|jgi:tetratricopeptide (TPR) repeat protein|nr:tetratricopeptide repeat protein [Pyrinomonadaceae bacterium]
MKSAALTSVSLALVACISFMICACNCNRAPVGSAAVPAPANAQPARQPRRGNDTTMMAVDFLEERVKSDPDDLVALNKLAAYYLQLHRETEDVSYLEMSLRAAQSSLRVLPADQNLSGLRALVLAEYETHNFVPARDHAKELTEYEPRRAFGFQLQGDALLELGDYDGAIAAYKKMEELDGGTVATETRLAHLALLQGDSATALRRYGVALAEAKNSSFPSVETIAWCHWQLGEVRAATGDYQKAAGHYQDALAAFPDYPHAVTSMARYRGAQGDLKTATEAFEKLVRKYADPIDEAVLGDFYKLAGRDSDAQRQYSEVERLSQQSALYSALYNRHLVLFWADHDMKTDAAYELAKKEFETRRDVYGADALAWAALKVGKVAEAQTVIKDALRLGTLDARLFYHAGMIARAAGDREGAADFLRRAIKLNPHFDPWQSQVARKALEEITGVRASPSQGPLLASRTIR